MSDVAYPGEAEAVDPIPDEVRAATVQTVREVIAELARTIGATPDEVIEWLTPAPAPVAHADLLAQVRASAEAATASAVEPNESDDDNDDPIEFMKRAMRDFKKVAKDMKRAGDSSQAVSAMRAVADMSNNVMRIEERRREREGVDGIVLTQAQVDEARDEIRARIAGLAERPLLCAACNRELSIEFGETKKE